MSFASGLFSFMGGASTQFREELDLAAQAKAAKAKADALAIKEEQERLLEAEKFKITTGLTQQEIDIKTGTLEVAKAKEKRLGWEFKKEIGFKEKVFDWEKKVWYDEYRLENNKYLLEKKDKEDQLKLAKSEDERQDLIASLKLLDQNWQHKQDTIQNEHKVNVLDFEKWKVEYETGIELEKALKESMKGTIVFDEKQNLSFNKGDYKPAEQPVAFLSWMNNTLTKEMVDAISTVEGKERLLREFNIANYAFVKGSVVEATGDVIDLAGHSYDNAYDLGVHLGGLSLKDMARQIASEENPDADAILVEAEQTVNGTQIKTVPIIYEELATEHEFEATETQSAGGVLLSALDDLVKITRKSKLNKPYQSSLDPFESRETLISSLEDASISLSILKLTPYFNQVQEQEYQNIRNSTDWDAMIDAAFEHGILKKDKNNIITGEEQLIKFMHMVQPGKEFGYMKGLRVKFPSNSPDDFGLTDTVNAKDAKAQGEAANLARGTATKMMDVLNDTQVSDKLGFSLNVAAKIYGVGEQFEQLSNFFNGGRNLKGISLIVGSENGGMSESKRAGIIKDIEEARKIFNNPQLKEDAKKKAKLTLLKFTLAYQVSMALQGGSGGRTISDQDVENILEALAMPQGFFATNTREATIASLQTLNEFLEGIELRNKYLQDNTMKGYRTYLATNEILTALTNHGGVGADVEEFNEQMKERHGIGTEFITETGEFDWGAAFETTDGGYKRQNGWSIGFTNNNVPVYIKNKPNSFTPNTSEAYLMSENDWNSFITIGQEKGAKIDDYLLNATPNFSDDPKKESYKGVKVKGLFSDLLNQEEDIEA
ncbi:hypothetical protein CMI37_19750 [Candidatus Pacearchaeota archaeon]|nr:hypothetical protein [Candidatus Pacearchaeota archaeon]